MQIVGEMILGHRTVKGQAATCLRGRLIAASN
ncbi:hypothetical protein SAMN05443245_6139 [Paraburkholderia fungorum]|uniref:Uncharacterized protein n=1 Tax=Paraburkholderia fungorum TaxID=134537 RepID=A0A1H1JDJ4_9BURK|nr:hypothetical protein SAMN05443245_6139 [Paraburkholderia fungorum]